MKSFTRKIVGYNVAVIGPPDDIQRLESVRMVGDLKRFDLVFEEILGDLIGHILHVNGLYGNLPPGALISP